MSKNKKYKNISQNIESVEGAENTVLEYSESPDDESETIDDVLVEDEELLEEEATDASDNIDESNDTPDVVVEADDESEVEENGVEVVFKDRETKNFFIDFQEKITIFTK